MEKRKTAHTHHQKSSKSSKHSVLYIQPKSLEDKSFPTFQKPVQLATFSTKEQVKNAKSSLQPSSGSKTRIEPEDTKFVIDIDVDSMPRVLHENNSAHLMDFSEPKVFSDVHFDLNVGYGTQIAKSDDNQHINLLLYCVLRDSLVDKADFICWRGLLTKIAASPYEDGKFDDGLVVVVQKVNNKFYMCEFPTESAKATKEHQTDKQKLMGYWGMKFESYLTCKPGSQPNPSEPMNFNHEFSSVVSTKLGKYSLLFAGEVDCCLPGRPQHYIELKTTRKCEHKGQEVSFRRFKLLKWWLQSFLIGIEDIFVGYRNDEGIIENCEWMKVQEMPRSVRQDRQHWKPNVCFNFLETFLKFVTEHVAKEFIPHVFTRAPHDHRFQVDVDTAGSYKFLPSWYFTPTSAEMTEMSHIKNCSQ